RCPVGTAEVQALVLNFFDRYAVRQRAGGPRLRFGVAWFVCLMAVLLSGSFAVTVLFAVAAGVAALQTAGAWRSRKVKVNQAVAGSGAALMTLAAWHGNRAVGVALLIVVVAAVLLGADTKIDRTTLGRGSFTRERLSSHLPIASATLRSCLFVGLAGAATVQVHRTDPMSFLYLVSVACVYDSGDYLVGSGSRRRIVGTIAGLIGVVVVVLAMTAIQPAPLKVDSDVRWLGLAMGLACPLGQLLASWTLPNARAKAPALRRLDSWLITAPACLVGLWILT
ncbi:MAG TPA: hypothetical protein PLV93_07865, partial [Microthrixaceae bacterium]|nr:hypothetical protein [Microthrixaceae bacterium]